MPQPSQLKIEVADSPQYLRDIKNYPKAVEDVQNILDTVVIPALHANPIAPYPSCAAFSAF